MTTDEELIARFLGGDKEAFDELMRAHEERVFAICLRMLRDRQAALDATQDTFLALYRKADRFHGRAAFSTWLYRVTINTCYDSLRRAKRRTASPLPESNDPPDAHAEDLLRGAELRPDVETALSGIAPEFRAVVVLVDMEGLALETVAEMLDVPVGTVKSRVFRGRRLLANVLGNFSDRSDLPRSENHG